VRNFRKSSDILQLAGTWVLLDENPASINDGWFVCDPRGTSWVDVPATYHNGATGFAFADGHSEIKKCTTRACWPTPTPWPADLETRASTSVGWRTGPPIGLGLIKKRTPDQNATGALG
jgi:prepilin-type processing-associated H-X9-DG protein